MTSRVCYHTDTPYSDKPRGKTPGVLNRTASILDILTQTSFLVQSSKNLLSGTVGEA